MTEILWTALGGLALFLLGVASTWLVSLRKRAGAAEARVSIAERVAHEAAAELATVKEEERVEELSDDEADREARDLGVLSERSPRKRTP